MVEFDKQKFIDRLLQRAQSKGIENIEENKLIHNFFSNYEFYWSLMEKAVADGMISLDDKVELYKYRAKIVLDNLKLLNQNDVEKDDIDMLIEIMRIIEDMRLNEEKFPSLV